MDQPGIEREWKESKENIERRWRRKEVLEKKTDQVIIGHLVALRRTRTSFPFHYTPYTLSTRTHTHTHTLGISSFFLLEFSCYAWRNITNTLILHQRSRWSPGGCFLFCFHQVFLFHYLNLQRINLGKADDEYLPFLSRIVSSNEMLISGW